MVDSHDNKGSPKNQDGSSQNPFPPNFQPPTTWKSEGKDSSTKSSPTPDKAEKTDYMTTNDVAKIIGVTRKAVEYWRKCKLFNADMIDHCGVYYYKVERVMQLKSVYHKDWKKGSYAAYKASTKGEMSPVKVMCMQKAADDVRLQIELGEIENEIVEAKPFNHLIAQWRTNHKNAPVDPKIIAELKNAKAYIDNLTPENFNPDDVFNISIRRKIALCKFYLPQFAANFFNVMRDARDSAKKKIKNSDNPSSELKNLANLVPSDFVTIVDEVVTTIKRDQKEYQKAVEKKEAQEKDLARWKEKQTKPKNPKLLLSPEQVTRLFAMKNTDLYNALRLDYLFNNEIRFLTDCDRWLTFDKDKGIWIKGKAESSRLCK